MKKGYSKFIASVLTLSLTAGLMTGCGNSSTTSSVSSDVVNEESSTPSAASSSASAATSSVASETSTSGVDISGLDFTDTTLAKDAGEYDSSNWTDESDKIYNSVLGDFYKEYQTAVDAGSVSEKFTHMAIAEAKMLESAIMIPLTSGGGNYAISQVIPRTAPTVLYGMDQYRQQKMLVADTFLTPDQRQAIRDKWNELKGTGTFREWVLGYCKDNGINLKDTYNTIYVSDPVTWDTLNSSRASDNELLSKTWDPLLQYDDENVLQPALADSYEVSDDGLTYTFHLKKGLKWVDSQGREVADLKADDFVAGMQHLLDCKAGLEYLLGADGAGITNVDGYVSGDVTDFTQVGVKAVDDYTVQYSLDKPCTFFTTMLSYSVFAPMSRAYYTSQGGKFGADFSADDSNYKYGKDADHIAYCGPYLITNATEKNTIVLKLNDSYWDKDNCTIKTVTWMFDDGTDATRAYNLAKDGKIDGSGLNSSAIEAARKDGLFDKYAYVSDTDASSFMGFLNLNRKAFANFNDASKCVSNKTVGEANRTYAAMQNLNFRRAICNSLDRASYNAQARGEDVKLTNLRNTYVPGNFVTLDEDVTVDINGTSTTFKAGTYFGEIEQAQLDADGYAIKVWDADTQLSDGFDGWYNKDLAKTEIEAAVSELAAQGLTIDKDHPIQLDYPCYTGSEIYANRGNVLKQSIEEATEGYVQVNIIECADADSWYYAEHYPETGYQSNDDLADLSGWSPDYGDPQTYLGTLLPNYSGYMTKTMGMY